MEEYSILIGADGEEGLENLIKMIRFDITLQVYMVPTIITDETFCVQTEVDCDNGTTFLYTKVRTVSIRENNNVRTMDVFYSPESKRYYVSVARIAKYLHSSTTRFLQYNINGKYENYYLVECDKVLTLVKGLYS